MSLRDRRGSVCKGIEINEKRFLELMKNGSGGRSKELLNSASHEMPGERLMAEQIVRTNGIGRNRIWAPRNY
jgi:hypothetical protein